MSNERKQSSTDPFCLRDQTGYNKTSIIVKTVITTGHKSCRGRFRSLASTHSQRFKVPIREPKG
ncbi:hypothetical protein HMPREF9374_3622 [Desmospora sp. 8437]|nr:hypothetical protein HMPREF9374_3622 [Desmospora sp. 8437]